MATGGYFEPQSGMGEGMLAATTSMQIQASRNNTAAKKQLKHNVATLQKRETKELYAIELKQKQVFKDYQKVQKHSRDVDDWLEESRRRTEAMREMEYAKIQRRIGRMKQVCERWGAPLEEEVPGFARSYRGNYDVNLPDVPSKRNVPIIEYKRTGFSNPDKDILKSESKGRHRKKNRKHSKTVKLPEISTSQTNQNNMRNSHWAKLRDTVNFSGNEPDNEKLPKKGRKDSKPKISPARKFFLVGLTLGKFGAGGKIGSEPKRRVSLVVPKPRKKTTPTVKGERSSKSLRRNGRRRSSTIPALQDIHKLNKSGFHLFDYSSQLLNTLGGGPSESESDSDDSEEFDFN